MELYNPTIRQITERFSSKPAKNYPYNPGKTWPETDSFELVMQRDTALSLGGDRGTDGVNITCVTSSPALVSEDAVTVIGPDLQEIKAGSPYARITLLRVSDIESDDEDDTEVAFRAIQDMDFVKYHVFPKGYMLRISSGSNVEQVRVSKDALKSGISFERIGNTFISHYKKNENVLNAHVFFITDPSVDYKALLKDAKTVHDITMTLTKILEGLSTDCASCNLKDICDEIEGMKELHFGKGAKGAAK